MEHEVFLNRLLDAVTVSGEIAQGSQIVKEEMEPFADQVFTDILNDTVAVLNPQAEPKILATAHLDEIGLVITCADEHGYLYAIDRGGVIPQTYPGHKVQIHTERGMVKGVVNGSRALCRKEKMEVTDLVIDIGADSKEEALSLVKPGSTVTFDCGFEKLSGGRFAGRALDDRLVVYIIMEAFKRVKEAGTKRGVYCAATAGEETTKNGAYFTAGTVKPDLAVVVDVTYCTDYPYGYSVKEAGEVKLGAGPVLCNSPLIPSQLNRQAEKIAARRGIPVQYETASRLTCTDADKIHFENGGTPVILVSIPLRYMHSPAEVADERDVEGCIGLVAGILEEFEL